MDMKLRTVGLVAALFKVEDTYRSTYDAGLCATSLSLDAREGRRARDTKVTFDRTQRRSHYLERDSISGATLIAKEMDIPSCVHDVPGGWTSCASCCRSRARPSSCPSATARSW